MKNVLLIFCCSIACFPLRVRLQSAQSRFSQVGSAKLEEVFRWKQLYYEGIQNEDSSFRFPGEFNNRRAKSNSQMNADDFIPYNNVPMGVDHFNGKVFITVPRRRTGIPATLNYVTLVSSSRNKSPHLIPFPDLRTNTVPTRPPDANRIISVYRTRIDECGRMWFVDTGMLELPDNLTQIQPPSIWVMDPTNGRTLRRFEIPDDIVTQGNGMASITVDVQSNNCNDAYAYIPDLITGEMYVYSLRENQMWSFAHNYFHRSPLEGEFNVAGLQYQWDDNLFSITLGPQQPDGFRSVFFHPMISTNEFVVSSKILKNSSLADRSYHGNDFSLYGNRGPFTQTAMHQYDTRNGVMLYAEIGRNAIGCWSSQRPFNAENHGVIARDDQRMIYPSDLKVDFDGTLWIFSNSLPVFLYSTLNVEDYNFRVWRANVNTAVQGTVCDGPS